MFVGTTLLASTFGCSHNPGCHILVHDEVRQSIQDLAGFVLGHIVELRIVSLEIATSSLVLRALWNPFMPGTIKLNFDASFCVASSFFVLGVLTRNENGEIMGTY